MAGRALCGARRGVFFGLSAALAGRFQGVGALPEGDGWSNCPSRIRSGRVQKRWMFPIPSPPTHTEPFDSTRRRKCGWPCSSRRCIRRRSDCGGSYKNMAGGLPGNHSRQRPRKHGHRRVGKARGSLASESRWAWPRLGCRRSWFNRRLGEPLPARARRRPWSDRRRARSDLCTSQPLGSGPGTRTARGCRG